MTRPVIWIGGGLLLLGLIPLTWLGPGELVNGNDTNYPLKAEHFLAVRLSSWDWTLGAGISNLGNLSTATWGFMILGLQELTGSEVVAQRILLVFWFTAIPASFAFLFRTLTGRWRVAHLIGAVAYALNPFFMNAWSNVLVATIGAGVAAPLLLALALRLLPKSVQLSGLGLAAWGAATLLLSLVGASPPLLAIVVATVVCGTLWLARPIAWERAGLLAAIAIGVNAFWLLPQVVFLFTTEGLASTKSLQALGQEDWTEGVSANTSLLNVLRGAGAWDWFHGWEGEPYVSYAEGYLHNPFLVAISIAIPLGAFTVLVHDRTSAAKFFGLLASLGLLLSAGVHPPFGGAYKWAAENMPLFGGFRSPWYKFGLATVFGLAGLIAIGLTRVTDAVKDWHLSTRESRFDPSPLLLIVAANALLLYGWPLVTGDVLLQDRAKPPGFRVTVPSYVSRAGEWIQQYGPGTRVLWLPRRSEIYDWGLATGAGTLLTYVSDASVLSENQFLPVRDADRRMTVRLLDSLDRGLVTEALRIARLLGIRLIVVRGDVDEKFYGPNPESSAFLQQVLEASTDVKKVESIGRWTIYELRRSPARVAGTAYGLVVPGPVEKIADAATFFPSEQATLVSADAARAAGQGFPALPQARLASPLGTISLPEFRRPRHALVKVPSSRFRVSLERDGRYTWLTVRRLTDRPTFGRIRAVAQAAVVARKRIPPAGRSGTVFRLDGRVALGTIARLGPGTHLVQGFGAISGELLRDGSFERGHWMDPINAGPPPGFKSGINVGSQTARRVGDAVEGDTALELASTGNRAAVYRVLKAGPRRAYRISLSHRHVSGGPGAFALLSDGRVLIRRSLEDSRRWKTYKMNVRLPVQAKTLELYLYSDSVGERSVNRFDGVHVLRLGARRGLTLPFEVVPPLVSVPFPAGTADRVAFRPHAVSGNLVVDGSFERGHWMDAINAGPAPGSPANGSPGRQVARQALRGTEGRSALELISTGNRAAVFRTIAPFGPGRAFEVTFDHKHVRGGGGSYAVVTGSRTVVARRLPLRGQWTRHKAVVRVPRGESEVSLYLYSDSTGERSVNRFDRVRVRRLRLPEILLADAPPGPVTSVRLESRRISPVHYSVRVIEAPERFLLTLRENFHEGWRATGAVGIGPHFRSSGYANGWVVNGAARGSVIEIRFTPHRWTIVARLVSLGAGLLLVISIIVTIVSARKRAAHRGAAITSAAGTS